MIKNNENIDDYIVKFKNVDLNIETSKNKIKKRMLIYIVIYITGTILITPLFFLLDYLSDSQKIILALSVALISAVLGLMLIPIMYFGLKMLYYWKLEIKGNVIYVNKGGKKIEISYNDLILIDTYVDEFYRDIKQYKVDYTVYGIRLKYINKNGKISYIRLPYRTLRTISDDIFLNTEELNKLQSIFSLFITKNQIEKQPELENIPEYYKIRESIENRELYETIINDLDQKQKFNDIFVIAFLLGPCILGIIWMLISRLLKNI